MDPSALQSFFSLKSHANVPIQMLSSDIPKRSILFLRSMHAASISDEDDPTALYAACTQHFLPHMQSTHPPPNPASPRPKRSYLHLIPWHHGRPTTDRRTDGRRIDATAALYLRHGLRFFFFNFHRTLATEAEEAEEREGKRQLSAGPPPDRTWLSLSLSPVLCTLAHPLYL